MKATGIVRRIDDLGRVVIPKEIRRTMRIREGDPLEIYTDRDGEVIFRKYSLMGGISDFAAQICDTVYKTTGRPALVTDRDTVLAVSGAPKREFGDKQISSALENVMMGRGVYQQRSQDAPIPIVTSSDTLSVSVAAPILAQGDVLGCVVIGKKPSDAPSGDDGPVPGHFGDRVPGVLPDDPGGRRLEIQPPHRGHPVLHRPHRPGP